MAISTAEKTYDQANTTSVDTQSVVNLDNVISPPPIDRETPAPDGFFDWVYSMRDQPFCFGCHNADDMTVYWNWMIEQHAVWFREKFPDDDSVTVPGLSIKVIEDTDTVIEFPGAAASAKRSKDDSGADDGKVSAAPKTQAGDTGSSQAGAGSAQRTSGTSR